MTGFLLRIFTNNEADFFRFSNAFGPYEHFGILKCHQITILVWNELHLRSKASGLWQSDKIDEHFFHYKTLVNFSNCRCNNRQTLFKFQNNLSIFKISKNRQMLFHYFKTLFTQRSTNT